MASRKVMGAHGLDELTLGDLLDAKRAGKDYVPPLKVSSTATISEAMEILAEHRVLSAPVVMDTSNRYQSDDDDDCEFGNYSPQRTIGFVDVSSLLAAFISCASQELGQVTGDADQLSKLGKALQASRDRVGTMNVINALASDGGLLRLKSPDAERYLSLRVVVGSSFQSPISNLVHHRVAVHDFDGAITHLISQSDLLRLFHTNPKLLGKSGPLTVSALRLGTREVFSVGSNLIAYLGFATLYSKGRSSAGVLDADGRIIGNLSVSDLRGIRPEQFSMLALPLVEFLVTVQAAAKAAAANNGARPSSNGVCEISQLRLFTAKEEDTLQSVVETIVEHKLHRVYLTDNDNMPLGIITLTDIIRMVLRNN